MIILMTTVLFKSRLDTYPTGFNLWVNKMSDYIYASQQQLFLPFRNKSFPVLCGFKGRHFGLLSSITSRQKIGQQHLNFWGKGLSLLHGVRGRIAQGFQHGFLWFTILVFSSFGFIVLFLKKSIEGNVYPLNTLFRSRENPLGLNNMCKRFSFHSMTSQPKT